MWPDRVSKPGPQALESDELPTALHGPATFFKLTRTEDFRGAYSVGRLCRPSVRPEFQTTPLKTLGMNVTKSHIQPP